jgi:hypothetical protein
MLVRLFYFSYTRSLTFVSHETRLLRKISFPRLFSYIENGFHSNIHSL